MSEYLYVKPFEELRVKDVPLVGGKNASLGELLSFGIPVPLGFAVTAKAFDYVLDIGNYFYENQNMNLALETYEKAETIAISDDSKVKVLSNMGAVNLQLGKYEDAIKTFEKVLKINDKDDITLTNLGVTYALNKDKVTAKKYLLKAKENCTSENQMNAIEQWLKKIEEQ